MDVDKEYFSNITTRERAIFEGAISMGALFHQFVGTPVNKNTKKSLETSMEESLKLQPAIEDVEDTAVIILAGKGAETHQKRGLVSEDYASDAVLAKKYLKKYDEGQGE